MSFFFIHYKNWIIFYLLLFNYVNIFDLAKTFTKTQLYEYLNIMYQVKVITDKPIKFKLFFVLILKFH